MAKILFPVLGPNKVVCLFAAGLLLILCAAYAGLLGFPLILASRLRSKISLSNESDTINYFKELPVPLEFNVYVFNVTNAEEVSQGGRPRLEQIGPYVYDEHKKKVEFSMPEYADYVTYREVKTYYFNKEKSNPLEESDVVTILNIPLLGSAYMVEERFPMGLAFLNAAIAYLFPNSSSPFMQTSVGELLFSGVPIRCGYDTGPAMPVCRGMATNLPPPIRPIPGTRDFAFSMFQSINGTASGLLKVNRGITDIYELGSIMEYNNLSYLEIWDRNSSCSLLRGTDSSILPPIKGLEDLYLYLSEVCLSLRAVYTGHAEVQGIPVYIYKSSSDNFASADELKENSCRCKKVEDKTEPVCLKKGAIDASRCQGAAVILTPPHFLNSDPEYTSYPVGLMPNESIHETQVFVEPQTGVPLAAYKRIQMNIFLKKFEEIDILQNVSEGLFPLVWVEEALPDEMLKIYLPSLNELMFVQKITDCVVWTAIGLGILCVAGSVFFFLKHNTVSCFRVNQVVANMSTTNPAALVSNGIDDKRTAYNIPITPLQTDNRYSPDGMFPDSNATFKTTLS